MHTYIHTYERPHMRINNAL